MSTGLKWFLALILTIFVGLGILFYAVRYHDGPMEIISGGPFTTGELIENVDDWSFLRDHQTVAMQTMVPPRSRTMWIVVSDNRPFIVSSFMNTAFGKLWKQWPRKIAEDNRVIIRVDGKLYRFNLERVTSENVPDGVLVRFTEKYGVDSNREEIENGNNWIFELKPAA